MSEPADLTSRVKSLALAAGFARVGIAPAEPLPREAVDRLDAWLRAGFHAGMTWFERSLAIRNDPRRLMHGARSVICLATSCAPAGDVEAPDCVRIGRYARGKDYHKVLKARCRRLIARLAAEVPSFAGRAMVDSAPVMERSLALLAGLGWIGENGCLYVGGAGSYVLLCEIVCNLPLTSDKPVADGCLHCGRCQRACPTGALLPDGRIDAARCISCCNQAPDPIGEAVREKMGRWVCGCDLCQEACPLNRDLPAGDAELRTPAATPAAPKIADVLAWDERDWDRATRGRGLRAIDYPTLLRNDVLAAAAAGSAALFAPLQALARRRAELAPLADWAAARIEANAKPD